MRSNLKVEHSMLTRELELYSKEIPSSSRKIQLWNEGRRIVKDEILADEAARRENSAVDEHYPPK